MLKWFHDRALSRRYAHDIYGSIVALARAPELYRDGKAPDTVEGRFELLVLHMYVILERLSEARPDLSQRLVNLFFADMDTTSRELGVGDMAVPKKMRKMAAAFKERMAGYKSAFTADDEDLLTEALKENIYGGDDSRGAKSRKLVRYVQRLRASLSEIDIDEIAEMDSNRLAKDLHNAG